MIDSDQVYSDKGEGSPTELQVLSVPVQSAISNVPAYTAVTVSMHSTNASEVRYLESDMAYSFHNSPKRSCLDAMRIWLREKYPSKNKCINPALQ
jgi:hypothetical protein